MSRDVELEQGIVEGTSMIAFEVVNSGNHPILFCNVGVMLMLLSMIT
jgi:hypothetical protein